MGTEAEPMFLFCVTQKLFSVRHSRSIDLKIDKHTSSGLKCVLSPLINTF